jgi:adenylate kinase family enzyme
VKRVLVIGCGGSGKTTVATEVARRLGLPLIHLDAEHFDEAWKPTDQEFFAARQHDLVAKPEWVIEGNYASTLPIRLAAADTLVILDMPVWVCLLGILQRRLRYRGGQHADGVFDRISLDFLRYIWNYRRLTRPRVRSLITRHGAHLRPVVLTSRRQANHWLGSIPADKAGVEPATPDGEH